jgi:hypothetical protein
MSYIGSAVFAANERRESGGGGKIQPGQIGWLHGTIESLLQEQHHLHYAHRIKPGTEEVGIGCTICRKIRKQILANDIEDDLFEIASAVSRL